MPLPVQGRHVEVVLSLDPTSGAVPGINALGDLTPQGPQAWTVQNFSVNPEQEVVTSRYLGTNEPDEDMQPMGYSGTFTVTNKTDTLLRAFDFYQAALEAGLPITFLITHTTTYRTAARPTRVVQYLRVQLNMSESYEPGRHSTIDVSWRSPVRIATSL